MSDQTTPSLCSAAEPGLRRAITCRRLIRRVAPVVPVVIMLLICRAASRTVSISTIPFPSFGGTSVLRRTRVDIGHILRLETWYQPSSISYRLGTTFHTVDSAGEELLCTVGMEGWARPQAWRGNLLRLRCECEYPRQHSDRTLSCTELRSSQSPVP